MSIATSRLVGDFLKHLTEDDLLLSICKDVGLEGIEIVLDGFAEFTLSKMRARRDETDQESFCRRFDTGAEFGPDVHEITSAGYEEIQVRVGILKETVGKWLVDAIRADERRKIEELKV